jgi:micrococcal nuclease
VRGFGSQIALLVAVSALGLSGRAHAQRPPDGPTHVWVNLSSKVYHCPGGEYYGRTKRGEYLTEPEARQRGYRPNGGRLCFPEQAAEIPGPPGGSGTGSGLMPGAGPPAPSRFDADCVVARIIDGDTIECRTLGSVRLIGMDTPEEDQEPFGTAATAALASLLPAGSTVQLQHDEELRDRNGRLLAYLWLDGEMVNWALVRLGWAVTLEFPPNLRYADRFRAAESAAEREGRGLWAVRGFDCRPADRRKRAC